MIGTDKDNLMQAAANANRMRLIWYSATVFISSAVLLVLEITAGRLIAPYVGVTIYSWTSIIGVILAGLSLGNWLGGRLADRGAGETATGVVLALSAATSLLSLYALVLVAPLIQDSQLDLLSSSFVYVLSMFFLPSVLLGIPTPLLTTLALNLDEHTGRIVGRMNALAALGSICGTFLTGFVLIQYMGSRLIILLSALLLLLLALPFLRGATKRLSFTVIAVVIATGGLAYQQQGFANPCDRESSYFCLRVVDASDQVPFGAARAMVLDHLVHGINHESEPGMLIAPYVHLMQELADRHFAAQPQRELHYFFAGGGSFTQPRALGSLNPGARVTVAEVDPMVTELARQRMFLSVDDIEVIHGDARTTLYRQKNRRYDVIVTDAFHDIAIPYHLVTQEYIELARSRLQPDGLFTTNVVDVFPNPRMVKSLLKTLSQSFAYVDIWLDEIPQQSQRMTFVIAASDKAFDEDILYSQRGFERRWFRINEPLLRSGDALADLPVFSDDFVPVERMISGLLLTPQGL
jgi:spermidine synthase